MSDKQTTLDQLVAKAGKDNRLTKKEVQDIRAQAGKLKDVNINLAYARMAVTFMKPKMKLVANWDQNLDYSAEGIWRINRDEQKSKAAWGKADKCVYGELREKDKYKTIMDADHRANMGLNGAAGVQNLRDIQILADLTDEHGCGNCGELAARTFMYLYHLGIRPLDYMFLDGADHSFVVIGRAVDTTDWLKWGAGAVVCDPWALGFYGKDDSQAGYVRVGRFGESFTAYSADQLGIKMRTMFPTLRRVWLAHSET